MSRDALKSLLDEVLDASSTQREERVRGERNVEAAAPVLPSEFTDVEEFRQLDDAAMCAVLAAAPRDDLLTVLSGASDGLRRKILTNLAPASVAWLKQNLEYFDEPTRALLSAGRTKLLSVANRLRTEGVLKMPSPTATSQDDEVERVAAAVAEVLTLIARRGRGALELVVKSGGDPLLDEGLALLKRGIDDEAVIAKLDARMVELRTSFERRMAVAREGVIAIAQGESPEAFLAKVERIGR